MLFLLFCLGLPLLFGYFKATSGPYRDVSGLIYSTASIVAMLMGVTCTASCIIISMDQKAAAAAKWSAALRAAASTSATKLAALTPPVVLPRVTDPRREVKNLATPSIGLPVAAPSMPVPSQYMKHTLSAKAVPPTDSYSVAKTASVKNAYT